jgi:hypothetical protein
MSGSSEKITDHKKIKKWIEERKGRPAIVKSTDNYESGILRVDFQEPDESLEEIPWDRFFEIFEERKLAFLHQDTTAGGKKSRFNKFVERD